MAHIWVSPNEVDEPRTYYTEWSDSEREREIPYSNTYIHNLEKWYWRIYLEGSSGETDIKNRLIDMGREEERREICGKSNMETYITICKIEEKHQIMSLLKNKNKARNVH